MLIKIFNISFFSLIIIYIKLLSIFIIYILIYVKYYNLRTIELLFIGKIVVWFTKQLNKQKHIYRFSLLTAYIYTSNLNN